MNDLEKINALFDNVSELISGKQPESKSGNERNSARS